MVDGDLEWAKEPAVLLVPGFCNTMSDISRVWLLRVRLPPRDSHQTRNAGVGPSVFPSNFTELDLTVAALHDRGFETGLWSSTGLPNITREVAGSGTRIAKTDVGWVGDGYKFALDALKQLTHGIEDNSDARRFMWTVEGWAGTHRYAVMWTGDDSGSFDYLRWQIPTFAGCGFSAQAHVSGDIDGIFGGSPETYTRDLQFKSLMTTLMVMSGWAANPDKQPWTWGEPYTSINRMCVGTGAWCGLQSVSRGWWWWWWWGWWWWWWWRRRWRRRRRRRWRC